MIESRAFQSHIIISRVKTDPQKVHIYTHTAVDNVGGIQLRRYARRQLSRHQDHLAVPDQAAELSAEDRARDFLRTHGREAQRARGTDSKRASRDSPPSRAYSDSPARIIHTGRMLASWGSTNGDCAGRSSQGLRMR